METKEYPAKSGAPVEPTPPVYPVGVSDTGLLAVRPQLDTVFLTALLHAGNRGKTVLERVHATDFYNPVYGAMYERIKTVAATGDLTPLRVWNALTATRWTTDVYWHGKALNLIAPGGGSYEDSTLAAVQLVQGSLRHRVVNLAVELRQAACERPLEELTALLDDSARMDGVQACRARLEALTAYTTRGKGITKEVLL